ncbi:hypothetical protein OSB04_002957 [Centaurea solstitialis]|uniref:Staygreen protein domain-containing protein n=1 Tax=Centaurea solstitialis TaxID=347529 RepID=A0AA38WVI4_9ASTR|nr:hypothetical protein OSB04_002957 [Centaurea solstitialis]
MAAKNLYTSLNCTLNPPSSTSRRYSPHSVLLPDSGPSYNPLVFQAAKLLGPPATFDASKLQVVFKGEETEQYTRIVPRTYKLSHCDFTANLTLTISNIIDHDEVHNISNWILEKGLDLLVLVLKGWYNKDDVVAQWAEVKGHMCLDVHCYVSGPNSLLDLAAEFRYYIFSKELPLVLEAVLYGDRDLFNEHTELMDAFVRVFFHSSSKKYNRVECWGPLKDAAKVTSVYILSSDLTLEWDILARLVGISPDIHESECLKK